MKPIYLILIGGLLAITGVVLPLLMVIKVLPSTFFLAFFSHGASVGGIFIGIIGAAMIVRDRK
jgi:hypothetical protein